MEAANAYKQVIQEIANSQPTQFDLRIEVENDSQQSADNQPTVEETIPLIANTRHEWVNREPWAVVICNKGANRRPILYTISKNGKYSTVWHSQHWQSARQQYLANTQRRTVGNRKHPNGSANTPSGGSGNNHQASNRDGGNIGKFQSEEMGIQR